MQTQIIEGFKLSPQQKRLWLLQQDSVAYKAQLAILIEGNLNVKFLQEALHKLIKRYEVLRTTFSRLPEMKIPIQVIRESGSLLWQEVDLSSWESEKQEKKIAEIFEEEGQCLFELEKNPLLRFTIIIQGIQKHILLITLPSLNADAWALENLLKEISDLYKLCDKESEELLTEPIQYIQFSELQNELLELTDADIEVRRWRTNNFSDLLHLKLPFENQPFEKKEFAPKVLSLVVHSDLRTEIEAIVREHKTSISVFFVACWQVLLWRLTGQSDMILGINCNGRIYEELQEIIGLFANYLPIHYFLEKKYIFSEVMRQIDESLDEVKEWQEHFPWEQIVGAIEKVDELSFFPFCFDFEERSTNYLDSDISFEVYKKYVCFDRFKVKLSCFDRGGAIATEFHYDSNLFSAESVERLAKQFNILLESILSNLNASISELQIMSATERQQLLVEWNNTQVNYPENQYIHRLFEAQVELTPDAIAVVFEDEQLTYRDLNHHANQLAHYLRSLGVRPEVLVGICVERSLLMVVGLLGILKAGGAYVPLDPAYPQERLALMLEDSQVLVLLTQKQLVETLPPHQAKVICIDIDWEVITQQSPENPASGVKTNNSVYVIYTSGSTGRPKGVINTHMGICNRLLWMQDTYQLMSGDSVLQKTPFSFDVSVWEFFWPLLNGVRLVVAQPGGHQDSTYLVKLVVSQQITTLHFVPSMLQVFLEEQGLEACNCLKRVICSGEVLSFELQKRFFARLEAELHNLFGPTEAAIDVTFWDCKRQSSLPIVPIGRPIANTQIYVLDFQGQPVPIGILGEVYIGGTQLARGYLNRPELTAEKFIPNSFSDEPGARLYRSGDLARYLSDGNIEYLGRTDHQVKIRGFRIELGDISAVLSQHPAVWEVVVLAREDEEGNNYLVAYVVSERESALTTSELHRFLQEKLPNYMVPSAFVFLNALPLTVNGKVDTQALPPPSNLRPQLEVAYVMPRTEIERTIATVWQKTLNQQEIGIHDNFFELGGNSLLLFQVHSQLLSIFQKDLSMLELFKYPTISSLGEYFSNLDNQSSLDCEN
ncbi:MAG: amino acid adenylation domain-containing protein, partial [Rhizonema sp. PD38]|nr:amino acid adenylation domain-containing protein [Rhizonema sp. PD38]